MHARAVPEAGAAAPGPPSPTPAERALAQLERDRSFLSRRSIGTWLVAALVLAFFAESWKLAQVDLERLVTGLPKLGHWLAMAWPPKTDEIPVFAVRIGETIGMAAIGTLFATILAVPMAILASRNITPFPRLYYPARWLLNALRGIDSFVFALLFVASVGLGPFAGVLGIALHTWGSAAKFIADYVESANLAPFEAVSTTGASRAAALSYALLPDVLPATLSTTLYLFEFNVRASTVLGVVGAGGIGQELKNSLDLLDFARLATILLMILVVVTAIDQLAAWLRRRLT